LQSCTSVPKIDKDLLEKWCGEAVDRLEAMSIIVAVTETGSFSAASRLLRIPVATVSRKVADPGNTAQSGAFPEKFPADDPH
jgi:hypothetical protein